MTTIIKKVVLFAGIPFLIINVFTVYLFLTSPADPRSQDLSPCQQECLVFNENLTRVSEDNCTCNCETVEVNICEPGIPHVKRTTDLPEV